MSLAGGALPVLGETVPLVIADLALTGYVLQSAYDQPDRPRAIIVGGNGWDRPVAAPMSYQSSIGVRLASVLRDLSRFSGETLVLPADRAIGQAFAFPASTARTVRRYRDVLSALVTFGYVDPWRVDPDGVTRFGARVGVEVTARATDMGSESNVQLTTYGVDSPAAFLPGNVVAGTVIQRLTVRETAGSLTVGVWA